MTYLLSDGSNDARAVLTRSCRYLRAEHGRTISEAPRRILTAAMRIVGTDAVVDLRQRNIAARLGKE
jgi:hypothetical protein